MGGVSEPLDDGNAHPQPSSSRSLSFSFQRDYIEKANDLPFLYTIYERPEMPRNTQVAIGLLAHHIVSLFFFISHFSFL